MGEHSAELVPTGYWYVDPQRPDIERWYDGTQATDVWRWRESAPIPQRRAYQTSPVTVIFAWTVAILSLGYMLPWAIAATRSLPNHAAIGLVAFLTGWTGIGWIIALAMSASQKQGATA